MIKNEDEEMFADSNSIINRWKDCFSQLLNVTTDNDVGEIELHSTKPLIPEPTLLEFEIPV